MSAPLVSDNGPCFNSGGFARFIDARPELRHIRTRRRSPQTNGVIERYLHCDRPIERYHADPDNAASDAVCAPLPTRQTMRIP